MPAELFDPASRPAPVGTARRLTVTTSILLHAVIVVLIVVIPLLGGVSLPLAMSRMDAFVAPPAIPAPPPQPPAARPAVTSANPDAAPIHAPDAIAPEVERPAAGVPQAIGGLPMAQGTGVPGVMLRPDAGALGERPPERRPDPVRPGGAVQFPKRVTYVEPVYPAIAISARVEGTVILEAIIDENGAVTGLKVLRSVPLLDAAAKEAVRQWRYSPTTLNGIRVPLVMTVTVTFRLR